MGFILKDANGRQFIVGEVLRIGSEPSNQIVLQDPQVLPYHATLSAKQGSLLLRDENSPIGTYVNQKRVQGTVSLRAGDQISVGSAVFMVEKLPGQPGDPPEGPGNKKGAGCLKWGLLGVLVFLVLCVVVVAGGGYYFYNFNTDAHALIDETGLIPTPAPELDQAGNPIGPEYLSLNDPALNARYTSSFQFYQEDSNEGFDKNNAPLKHVVSYETMQQDQPEWLEYSHTMEKDNGAVTREIDAVTIKGIQYSGHAGKCGIYKDTSAGKHELIKPMLQLKGQVHRVEKGVTINGVLTDRYELPLSVVGTGSVIELKSGSLYRARQGGYLVRNTFSVLVKAQSYGMNMGGKYSPDKPALLTFSNDYTYFPNGTLKVKVPPDCAAQVHDATGN